MLAISMYKLKFSSRFCRNIILCFSRPGFWKAKEDENRVQELENVNVWVNLGSQDLGSD